MVMSFIFFFNDTATTEIYTLSLHDALPISAAAMAPLAALHAPNSAATVATPPLASTCRAVRRGPCRSASWVRRLPERRNAPSSASPPQPRPHVVPAPTAQAAISPSRVSHFTRRAG